MATRRASKPKAETLEASGVIEKMARNEKAMKLEGDDDWYSVFKAPQMNGAKVGDEVEFEYIENEKGGTTFRNIQGNVQITKAAPKSASRSSSGGGGGFDEDKDRRISRLSIMRGAIDLVAAVGDYEGDTDAAAKDAIAVASQIEAYVYDEEEDEE